MRRLLIAALVVFASTYSTFAMTGVVTLLNPANNSWTNQDNDTIDFSFIMSVSESFASCTLFLDNGTLYPAGTNSTVFNNTNTAMQANFSLAEKYNPGWQWFVNCTNVTTIKSETWILNVDRTAPGIAYSTSSTPEGNFSRDYISVNVTASDSGSLENITIYLYNSTDLVNETQSVGPYLFVNFTNLPEGEYYVNATANDSATNQNSTPTRWIILDRTAPSIDFVSPTKGSGNYSQNYIEVNISSVDTLSGADYVSIYLYGPSGLTVQTLTAPPFFYNFTGLQDGRYYVNATSNDTAGNYNQTGTRTFELDTQAPLVQILTQNGTTQYITTNYVIQFSVSDPRLESCWYSEDGGANQSTSCTSSLSISGTAGWHTVRVYANDSLGQVNWSEVMVNVQFKKGDGSSCTAAIQCQGGYCVNGYCSSSETYCGDGYCESPETYVTCSEDCPAPASSSKAMQGVDSASKDIFITPKSTRILRVYVQKVPVSRIKVLGAKEGTATVRVSVAQGSGIRKAYTYFEVDVSAPVKEAWIEFKVPRSWLKDEGLSEDEVRLFRQVSGEWVELETTIESANEKEVYYTARLEGFSLFAVGGKQQEVIQESPSPAPGGEVTPESPQETNKEEGVTPGQEPPAPSAPGTADEMGKAGDEGKFSLAKPIIIVAAAAVLLVIWKAFLRTY